MRRSVELGSTGSESSANHPFQSRRAVVRLSVAVLALTGSLVVACVDPRNDLNAQRFKDQPRLSAEAESELRSLITGSSQSTRPVPEAVKIQKEATEVLEDIGEDYEPGINTLPGQRFSLKVDGDFRIYSAPHLGYEMKTLQTDLIKDMRRNKTEELEVELVEGQAYIMEMLRERWLVWKLGEIGAAVYKFNGSEGVAVSGDQYVPLKREVYPAKPEWDGTFAVTDVASYRSPFIYDDRTRVETFVTVKSLPEKPLPQFESAGK